MTPIRLLPAYGAAPQCLIICLHGVGADAASMRPLCQRLHAANPTSAVIIPNAPTPSDLGGGYQWFSVRGITDTNRAERITAALPWLDSFIADERQRYGVEEYRAAVCGFSQGAMMALALVGRPHLPSAVAAIAGRIAAPIASRNSNSTSVFLSHGDLDPVVPFACLSEAERAFRMAGYPVSAHPVRGLGHMIAQEQADAVGDFLLSALNTEQLECSA